MQPTLPIFLASDQPTTCPTCGVRSAILLEETIDNTLTQHHACLNVRCGSEFYLEFES